MAVALVATALLAMTAWRARSGPVFTSSDSNPSNRSAATTMNPSKPSSHEPATPYPELPIDVSSSAALAEDGGLAGEADPTPEGPFEPPNGVGFSDEDAALVELATASPSADIRAEAALELRYRRSPVAVPTLIGMLGDGDANVRLVAAEGLADLDAKVAIASLEEARDRETDSNVVAALSDVLDELAEAPAP